MRAVLIINPVSGDDTPNAEKVDGIKAMLERCPFRPEVIYTTEERGAGQIAREVVAGGAEVVMVGGGDGTVSEVARELVHKNATLGVLPIGTFNNIARSLGILADLPLACETIAKGHTRAIDVGQANERDYFFEAAGAGLDATLFPIGEEIKGGKWTRVFQAAKLTFQYDAQIFDISFDCTLAEAVPAERQARYNKRTLGSREIRRKGLLLAVGNGPYYGGGYTVVPNARMTDGKLTLSIYSRFSKWELIRHFQSVAGGQYLYSPKLETFSAKEVRISSPREIPVHVDGHPSGHTPITLRSVAGALRVFTPERKDLPPSEEQAPTVLPAPKDKEKDKPAEPAPA